VKTSSPVAVKRGSGERNLIQRSLAEGLNLHPADNTYVILQDQVTHLEYILSSTELRDKGLYLQLNGYKVHVFMNIREVEDNEWHTYRQVCGYLNGRGVPSVEEAMQELTLQPVQTPFLQIANPGYFTYLMENRATTAKPEISNAILEEADRKLNHLLDGIAYLQHVDENRDVIRAELEKSLRFILTLPVVDQELPLKGKALQKAFEALRERIDTQPMDSWFIMLGWAFTHHLGKMAGELGYAQQSQSWFDEWKLGKTLAECGVALGMEEANAWRLVSTLRMMTLQQGWYSRSGSLTARQILEDWLNNDEIQHFLGVNRYKDVLWFNQEAFDQLTHWMTLLALLDAASDPNATKAELVETMVGSSEIASTFKAAAAVSEYRVSRLLDAA